MSPGFNKSFFTGNFVSVTYDAISQILGLVWIVLLTKSLGPEGYGVYGYAMAVLTIILVFSEAGLPMLVMREVASAQSKADWGLLRGLVFRSIQVALFLSIFIYIFGLTILNSFDLLQSNHNATFYYMLLIIPIATLYKLITYLFSGLQYRLTGRFLDVVLRPILVLILVFTSLELTSPQAAILVQLLSAAVALFISVFVLKHLIPRNFFGIEAKYKNKEWLKSLLPFTFISASTILSTQTDLIMIAWILPMEDVGIYRTAVHLSTMASFGLIAINGFIAPRIAFLYAQKNMQEMQEMVTFSAKLITAIATLISLVFIFMGEMIIKLLFGGDFIEGVSVLNILIFGQVFNAFFGSVGFLLNMTNNESYSARILLFSTVINIGLNIIMIPVYGIEGAAYASVVSVIFWNIFLYKAVVSKLKINPFFFNISRKNIYE